MASFRKVGARPFVVMFFATCWATLSALDEEPDSLNYELENVVVTGKQATTRRLEGGGIRINNATLGGGARMLGEADAINLLKSQTGIDSHGDYGSGIVVDGSSPDQTIYMIDGVPVIFPYRFGGVFSTFNNSHFKSTIFERDIHGASMPSRLGSSVNFSPLREVGKTFGNVNVGMLSSSATIALAATDRLSIVASGRISYIDKLYGSLLKDGKHNMGCDFSDLNLGANYRIGVHDCLTADFMMSDDRLEYDDKKYAMSTNLKWNNRLISFGWNHSSDNADYRISIYDTGFKQSLDLTMSQMGLSMASRFSQAGSIGSAQWRLDNKVVEQIAAGYEATRYSVLESEMSSYGYGSGSNNSESGQTHPIEGRIYGDLSIRLNELWKIDAGVSASIYDNRQKQANYSAVNIEPRATLTTVWHDNIVSIHGGLYHQAMHQAGFSDIGLASDFRFMASKSVPVQRSINIATDWSHDLEWNQISLSAGLYYKLVRNQPEFRGQLVSLLSSHYNFTEDVENSRGYNIGGHVEASRTIGRLTGHIGYGYGSARRRYGSERKYYRGITSMGHSVKIALQYELSEHWSFEGRFVYASGRPYTPVKALYVIAGNLIEVRGTTNSSRFPAYHRADLSVTYRFETQVSGKKLVNRVNLSLINAYGHRNIEIQSFNINSDTGMYELKQVSSLFRFMPSLSYTIDFAAK